MGNSPSTPASKSATPTQPNTSGGAGAGAGAHHHASDSPRTSKKEPKNLISAYQHQHRSAASSPEASVVSAQGSTIGPRNTHSKPLSILNSTSNSPSNSSQHSTAPKAVTNKPRQSEERHEPSKPVAVPAPTANNESSSIRSLQYDDSVLTPGPASSSIQDMSYHLSRPPRLPLPIEEEVHTPGSPIIAPTDIGEPIDDVEDLEKEDQNGLPRRASGLSNATDEDDAELRVDKTRPTVPTKVEWKQGGRKVYVTGTPFGWARKQRLFPAQGRVNVLEAVIPVYPGTHHIKFLVDGAMETSRDLPTTVDFGNNLVNYIEVSGEDPAIRVLPQDATLPKTDKDAENLPSRQPSQSAIDPGPKPPQKKVIAPAENFTSKVPQYLADFDQPEDAKQYQLSTAALDKLPQPPALPGFLSKPIMNNTTLIKDDNSVLNMPNHVVLNHLATSSIKNNVLAVSATTRYRDKYVTTIIYKPTSEET